MRPVSELYGRHAGADIYVVGTGTSLRVFPTDLLRDRITIGLNQAWRTVDVRYAITIHPDLSVPEYMGEGETRPDIVWITKREKLKGMPADHVADAHARMYSFRTDGQADTSTTGRSNQGRVTDWLRRPHGEFLYLWTSIAQPAVNLAAHMGARNIIVIGCDNAPLGGNHHAHGQPTMWQGAPAEQRYEEYYQGLAEVRTVLRERGVNVVSMTPFLTIGPPDGDFARLCDELDREHLIETSDITSTYVAPWRDAIGAARPAPSALARLAQRVPPSVKRRVPPSIKRRISAR